VTTVHIDGFHMQTISIIVFTAIG